MKRRNLILPALLVLVLLAAVTAPLLAQSGNSWYVQYYSDPNWSVPSVGMYSPYIEFNWGTVPPAPGMPSTNWTASMTSSAYFYAGNYTFSALADDEISMQIDGVTYINTMGAGMSGKTVTLILPMTEGYHNVVVLYRQYTGTAYVYLTWIYGSSKRHADAATSVHPLVRPMVVVLLPDAGDQRHHPVRGLHVLHPAEHPSIELLRLGRPMELAQHGLDPDRTAGPGMGQLHAGPAPVHAVGMQSGTRGGHLLQDRGRLVLLRSVPGVDADPVRLPGAHATPAASGHRMGLRAGDGGLAYPLMHP